MALFTIRIEFQELNENSDWDKLHAEMANVGFLRAENSPCGKPAWGQAIAEYKTNADLTTDEVLYLANKIAAKTFKKFSALVTKNYAVTDWNNLKPQKKQRKAHFLPLNYSSVYF
ncbi:hypothetical protein BH09BAC6_BH09BAC6_32870 [soil metagenome]|jgi:hypothetical protein